MNYTNWNLRGLNLFKEELIESNAIGMEKFPSINDFKNDGLYNAGLRKKIINYIESAKPIVSTSFKRKNVYTGEICEELSFFTDGEIIFNNLLQTYLYYNDFVLPEKWLEMITSKNFVVKKLEIDYDRLNNSNNVFNMFYESFDVEPSIQSILGR